MEILDYENSKQACRLCLKPDGIKLPIFGEVGVQRDVAYKINVCFALAIYETDPLSKLICHRCLYKLEQNYEFRSEVLSAFQQLKKAMSLRKGDPVIDKYLSMVEDEIIVNDGNEMCYPDNKYESELTDETCNNNPVEPSDECTTYSGDSPGHQDEQMEIIKHTPFDEGPAMDVQAVTLEVQTKNSSNEGINVCRHDGNEQTSKSSELTNQAYCDNGIEADKQEIVSNGLSKPPNVLETHCRPQPGIRSEKRKKHHGLQKKQAQPMAENLNLHWCNFCQKYLKTKKIFRQHNVKIHGAERSPKYECKCKKKFHSILEMLTHQQTHLKVNIKIKEDMLLKCNLCDKKFADNSILKMHSTTHSYKFNRNHLYKSESHELDTRKFKKGQKEKRIRSVAAPLSDPFVCDHCWQIFENDSSLSLHLNSKHCFILCNCISSKKTIYKNNSIHHMKEINNTNLPSDNTVSVTSLKRSRDHYQSLFTSLVNQCKICAKVFHSKKLLKRHQKKHIASEATCLSCSFCNRSFQKRSSLISHIHKHLVGEYYHCKYCTTIYSNREMFLSHKCLSNKVYPFCDLHISNYTAKFASQPHQNGKGYLSLLDHKDHQKTIQVNVSSSNQADRPGPSEEPEKVHTRCEQFQTRSKNYNRSNNRKHIKKRSSEYSRASQISRNENCVKCPFCHHLVKPENMYQHIYENHPDSNNIT